MRYIESEYTSKTPSPPLFLVGLLGLQIVHMRITPQKNTNHVYPN